jgi:hypothetical protein
LIAGIAGSNHVDVKDVRLFFVVVVCCVGSGYYGVLITRSEESTGCVSNCCDIETSTIRRPRSELGHRTTEKKKSFIISSVKFLNSFCFNLIISPLDVFILFSQYRS